MEELVKKKKLNEVGLQALVCGGPHLQGSRVVVQGGGRKIRGGWHEMPPTLAPPHMKLKDKFGIGKKK